MGLLITIIFVTIFKSVLITADMIKCHKKDECSCITDTKQLVSLWKLPSNMKIYEYDRLDNWLYAVDLCHGVKMTYKNKNKTEFACKNSTVCRYKGKSSEPTTAMEVGHFGSAVFGDYDNSTMTMNLYYTASLNETSLANSIIITLICNKSESKGVYEYFTYDVIDISKFRGKITTEAACLKPYHKPDDIKVINDNKTPVYVIVIAVVGPIVVIALIVVVFYRVKKHRENSGMNIQQHTEVTPLLV